MQILSTNRFLPTHPTSPNPSLERRGLHDAPSGSNEQPNAVLEKRGAQGKNSLLSNHKCKKYQQGVTFLELTIVIFLMAVLLSFALPNFSNLIKSNLELEANRIAKIVSLLRQQAIMSGGNYKLVFSTKDSSYKILTQDLLDPEEYAPHLQYPDPITFRKPIELYKVTRDQEKEEDSNFLNFEKIEFEKIFGQDFSFTIDSSGLIDLFTLYLRDERDFISLSVVNIMGKLVVSHQSPLDPAELNE